MPSFIVKDVLMGIPKDDLLRCHGGSSTCSRTTVSILEAISLTIVK